MILDAHELEPRDFYRHLIAAITPRPIGWISTISPGGVANLAPFSFFNGVGANPPAGNVVIGRILLKHVHDAVLDAAGQIDPDKLDTIGRMGGNFYARTRDRFALDR